MPSPGEMRVLHEVAQLMDQAREGGYGQALTDMERAVYSGEDLIVWLHLTLKAFDAHKARNARAPRKKSPRRSR